MTQLRRFTRRLFLQEAGVGTLIGARSLLEPANSAVYPGDDSDSRPLAPAAQNLRKLTEQTTILANTSDRVINTAASELQHFLEWHFGLHLSILDEATRPEDAIILGTGFEGGLIREFMERGQIEVHHIPRDVDGHEIKIIDLRIVVAGTNSRAVLYGVHRLEELLLELGGIPVDLREVSSPAFRLRVFHPRRWTFEYDRKDFRFLSHMGANVALLTHDWMKEKFFHSFASSNVFQILKEQDLKSNRDRLRSYIDYCSDYGMTVYLWICELPCQGGPWVPERERQQFLESFPSEVLSESGTYQGKVLCFSHQRVQQHYQQLLYNFLHDFPEVKGILLFGMDSSAEFCDPARCPRCAGLSKLNQRDRFIRFVISHGRQVRPDFEALTTNWYWDRFPKSFLEHQRALPKGSGIYCAPDAEAWSCDRKVTDNLTELRTICRENGTTFLGYDIFLSGDDTFIPAGGFLDFPLGVAAKLQRWDILEADGIFDQWGTLGEFLPNNAVVLRKLVWDPRQDFERVARKVALLQYGLEAGRLVFEAWREIEAAHRLWSDNTVFWMPQRMLWFPIETIPVPAELAKLAAQRMKFLVDHGFMDPALAKEQLERGSDLPWLEVDRPELRAGPVVYSHGNWWDLALKVSEAYELIVQHTTKAAAQLQEAVSLAAASGRLFYAHWYQEALELSPKQHIALQIPLLRVQAALQRETGYFFRAVALFYEIKHSEGNRKSELEKKYQQTLEASVQTLPELIAVLRESKGNREARPGELESWIDKVQARLDGIRGYLDSLGRRS